MKIEIDIEKKKEQLKRWFLKNKDRAKDYFLKAKIYVKANPKKSATALLSFFVLVTAYYTYRSNIVTTYYCIDRYATYKELKRKHKDDIEALQDEFKELAIKYQDEEDTNKGYVTSRTWDYKDGKWYFDPKQDSYHSGSRDVSREIDYVHEPCKTNPKKLRITCKIGYLTESSLFGSYKKTWSTVRTFLAGNFEKTVLATYPHFGGRRDVDVCYVEGSYSPFQSQNLHDASFYGHLDVVKFLIERGKDVNNKDEEGWTPLHKASAEGHLSIAKLLIHSKADVNTQNNEGYTPLHFAVRKGHLKTVRMLIDKGVDTNASAPQKDKPLHFASKRGLLRIAKLLLASGADVNIKGADGLMAIEVAKTRAMKRLLKKETKVVAQDTKTE